MGSIQLVMACDAPELALLKEGTTRLGELEIEVQHVHPRERHKKMAQSLAFDICEYSLVDYLNSFDRGLSFTAVPVFPHRVFRHRDIWVSSASGVTEPKQLNGARIGIQSWVNTAGVWQRGILQQDYGVDLKSIEWVRESPEEGEGKQGPNWARITRKPRDRVLEQMLASGDIAAMMLPRPPELHPEEMQRIGRLFHNYVVDEQGYYARTRLFPKPSRERQDGFPLGAGGIGCVCGTAALNQREEHPVEGIALVRAAKPPGTLCLAGRCGGEPKGA
ncbi:MAG: hypothetical protein HYY81_03825 [Deltaproteobacteria bacterium]|nr:hypothetical protein [Deltaproteobacteria bacterium]